VSDNSCPKRFPGSVEQRRQIEALGPWFHNLHLPHGLETAPDHFLGGDWVPNHAGVEAMLRSSGMRVTARPADEIYLCEPDPLAGSAESDSEAQLRSAAAAVGVVERPPVT
jgi:hypothetical protein